ncbi:MAG: hypothetical protein U9P90_00510 [Patescibacteria group bacterium]|nr:hypothetical protein [Patescibacteria group bacterium]
MKKVFALYSLTLGPQKLLYVIETDSLEKVAEICGGICDEKNNLCLPIGPFKKDKKTGDYVYKRGDFRLALDSRWVKAYPNDGHITLALQEVNLISSEKE